MKKKVSVWFLIIALLATVMLIFCAALAEEEKKEEEPKYKTIYYTEESDTVYKIQVKLQQLGFYEEGESFSPGKLDDNTVSALQRFYAENQLNWPLDGGISPGIQEQLIEGSPAPRSTPVPETPSPTPNNQPTPFPEVHSGERNDEVMSAVQIALFNKGYYEGIPNNYVLGYLDTPTEEAIKRFCEAMRFTYNPADGITQPLFSSIIAENAPVYATPSPTPFSILPYSSTGDEVRAIQNRLKELDYFRDTGDPEWGEYEAITHEAIRRFCVVHNIAENKNGIDAVIYNRLMSDKAKANPVERHEIHPQDEGEEVWEVQRRLNGLGYYKEGKQSGKFDEDMTAALASFAQINGMVFDGEVLTVALQEAIFAEDANPWSEDKVVETPKPSLPERLNGDVVFLGIRMPLFVLILVIAVILAALVFLIIRVFSSGKGDGKASSSPSGLGAGSGVSTGGGKQLNLEIRYHGDFRQASVSMDKPLRIGRNEQTLPLNPGDSDISRQHCQMSFRDGTLILRDYSTNGTEVNHQTYHNCECVIHSGDTVKIGNHEITVRY